MKKARPLYCLSRSDSCDEAHLRHNATFENTKHGSGSQEAFEALDESCTERDKAEANYKHRQVPLRTNLLEQDITWHYNCKSLKELSA